MTDRRSARAGRRSARDGLLLVVALTVGGLVATACVPPPSEPRVDASFLDEMRTVDPGSSTVRIRSLSCEGLAVGSGLLIDDRTIVTNRHVVEGSSRLEVETVDGQVLDVDVAITSQALLADLAVVRLRGSMAGRTERDLQPVELAPANPDPGAEVRVIGYPEGGPQTVTEGAVEEYVVDPRLGNLSKVIRSDAEVAPGSSGGPAVDRFDRVVGVVYAVEISTDQTLIIPVETLRRVLTNDDASQPISGC